MLTVFGGTLLQDHLAMSRDRARRHHFWNSFPVRRIVGLRHRCDASPKWRPRRHLAGNLERDVRRRTTDSISCCSGRVTALVSDQRPIPEQCDDVPHLRCWFARFSGADYGKVRLYLRMVVLLALAIGFAGVGFFIFTGSKDKLIPYSQSSHRLLPRCPANRRCSTKTLSQAPHFAQPRDFGVGTLSFAIEALYVNLSRPLGYRTPHILDSLGFAVLLFSLGYVAVQSVFASERRLLSIENELAIAREIQTSILPSSSPGLKNLRITAAYRPMTAVAGDFYDFIPIDQNRVGLLVADVSGHGVPAALIAAMIKVAMQSVVPCASDPRAVLRGLNRILSTQLHVQIRHCGLLVG